MRLEIDFNANKCHVMEIGKCIRMLKWSYKMGQEIILKIKEEKNLGVVIHDSLSPERPISQLFGLT